MRNVLLLLMVATFAATAHAATAAARSIKDCEKIQAADAYNLCLASFGPVAHEHELKPVPAGVGSGRLYSRRHRHYGHNRSRHGRKTMEISVGANGAAD